GVPAMAAAAVPGRREVFGVPGEGESGGDELTAEVRFAGYGRQTVVVGDALGRAREQRQVVRLARVCLGTRVGERRRPVYQSVRVRRVRASGDVLVGLVLEDRDDHVVRP